MEKEEPNPIQYVCIYIDSNERTGYDENGIEIVSPTLNFLKLPHDKHGFVTIMAELHEKDGGIYYKNQHVMQWSDIAPFVTETDKHGFPYAACFVSTNTHIIKPDCRNDVWTIKEPLLFDNVPIIEAWVCIRHVNPKKLTKYQKRATQCTVDTPYIGAIVVYANNIQTQFAIQNGNE